MSQWVEVYKAGNSLEAHSLKGMLEAEGIESHLKGESLSSAAGELPADVVAVTLWVESRLEDKARKVLFKYENQRHESWLCQQCHEENGGNFEVCWNCSAERVEK
ncbi:hypothetical protein CS022_12065 [Veronia nyctiphanis]|uniref:RanBP2-type domain-containing protein n=1 Tax=Veronia nyctiphanis TaxID=1278244 RepID=A0A4Q0YR21_9GAMM|nr:DUF2007 domain-containing protein [Veronia nyctiphanis]RXJ73023.1 hypothetical protein CS022_12065 [Veronia nyctiphanis]